MNLRNVAYPLVVALLAAACSGDSGASGEAGALPAGPETGRTSPAAPPDRASRPAMAGSGERSLSRVNTILVPRHQVDVLARISGLMERVLVEEGDRVSAGQILARVEEAPARIARDRAGAEAARALAVYARAREGAGAAGSVRVVSQMELEVAEAEYRMAQADSALRAMELDHTRVRSTIAGRVVSRGVEPGDWVGLHEPLFTVADLRVLRAVFVIPYAMQASMEAGVRVTLIVDPDGEARLVEGTVVLKSPIVDPASGGVKVTIEIANGSGAIRPGLLVAMEIGS